MKLIFSYRGCPVGSLEWNIELPRVSGRLIEVQYCATEGLRWAHWSCILSYQGSRVGSLEFHIELPRVSGGPIAVEY